MEKRTLLAIILSFGVLFIWYGLFPPPKPAPKPPKESQLVENKKDVSTPTLSAVTRDEAVVLEEPAPAVEESIHLVDTDLITTRFSNMGGNLKSITIRKYNTSLPITNILSIPGYEDKAFRLVESQNNRVTYQYQTQDLRITKTYKLYEDDALFKGEIKVTNLSELSKQINLDIDAYSIDLSSLDKKNGSFARDKMLMEYSVAEPKEVIRKNSAFKFTAKEERNQLGPIRWIGFRDRYFCALIKPDYQIKGYDIEAEDEEHLRIVVKSEKDIINPSDSISYEFRIFSGPQEIKLLKSYKMDFEEIMDFSTGNFLDIMAFGMTDGIARFLLGILNLLYAIFPNWGVCIMLLAFIVYGGTYPLTHKSLKSMRKMQFVQPEMMKLREKHKDSPEKLNKEVMELYKKHKVNPLGGCLPMLVQYPVFVGLYQLLWRYVAFKGAGFLWIKDLSEPDKLFTLKQPLPFIGTDINLIPMIFVILMLIQQKVSTKNIQPGGDPAQEATQKMMMKILPVMIFVIFYKIASGIALYFSMVSVFSIFAQVFISKKLKAPGDE